MHVRVATASALFALVLPTAASAQSLAEVREELSRALSQQRFAAAFASLILLSEELELSTARYDFDNPVDTKFSIFALPVHQTLHPWGTEGRGLHVEGVLGWARSTERTQDVYEGAFPGSETSVRAEWTTLGGLLGAGPLFRPAEDLELATIVNAGLSWIESDADYGGPGATASAALFDGIAFNWDGLALSGGLAARLDWTRALGASHELELVTRYDLRWTRTVETDDAAQRFSTRSRLLTLRGDLSGPTGLAPFGLPLSWRAVGGYRHFAEGDLFGVDDLIEVGGSLELDTTERWDALDSLALSAAIVLGEDLRGLSLGLGGSL